MDQTTVHTDTVTALVGNATVERENIWTD